MKESVRLFGICFIIEELFFGICNFIFASQKASNYEAAFFAHPKAPARTFILRILPNMGSVNNIAFPYKMPGIFRFTQNISWDKRFFHQTGGIIFIRKQTGSYCLRVLEVADPGLQNEIFHIH